ncbi:hypothetical protein THI4931_40950 [Pandoraea sputorum]|nr:hypothetical protein THI4931_40950 [Pandoraea sputorum]
MRAILESAMGKCPGHGADEARRVTSRNTGFGRGIKAMRGLVKDEATPLQRRKKSRVSDDSLSHRRRVTAWVTRRRTTEDDKQRRVPTYAARVSGAT